MQLRWYNSHHQWSQKIVAIEMPGLGCRQLRLSTVLLGFVSMVLDISYHKKEEVLQNFPAGSVFSPDRGLSQKHLTHASSSQRLWCPTGSPVLPPAKAGAHLGRSGRAQVAVLRCQVIAHDKFLWCKGDPATANRCLLLFSNGCW